MVAHFMLTVHEITIKEWNQFKKAKLGVWPETYTDREIHHIHL